MGDEAVCSLCILNFIFMRLKVHEIQDDNKVNKVGTSQRWFKVISLSARVVAALSSEID